MTPLRIDIIKALEELASQEEGMRFQGLAVVLGKQRWPELIARPRKKDFGLDAYAPSTLTPERIGKGLAASITPTLKKLSADAKIAKEHFLDLKALLFVTPAKVGNADRKQWEMDIQRNHALELHIIEREEIITLMMMPANAPLRASFLHLDVDAEPQVADLIDKARRAAAIVARTWASKARGHPLIDLTAVRLDPYGAESADVLSLERIDRALSQSGRVVLEAPAGRGKTTTLVQLAQRARIAGIPFMVDLPAWTSSRRNILEYIAGMPAFQAEGLTPANLARVQHAEPFLLLLNGWNEIAESNSSQANDALRELERDFPSAGIIVATRTHHLTPPLPGAIRMRLLRLRREQRTAYLTARLGAQGAEVCTRIETDPSLEELTRTPFILSEVASLFEAGAEVPTTKIGVLAQVLRLQEQRDEHRNALQAAPIFGRQTDYLKVLATELSRRGAVAVPEADARALVAAVARELSDSGQIEPVGAPPIIATLTAHHVLERVDYPQPALQFEHQQLQEYYAALDVRAQLLDLQDGDSDTIDRFTADYVTAPAWSEPLRMIAETFAAPTSDEEAHKRNTQAGGRLVKMALALDLVFAGELARLCGPCVWDEVRATVGQRFRDVYAIRDGSFRQYALGAMLATGADDFRDIVVPLLSGQDHQKRFHTYRLWPDMQVSSLGPNWQAQVRRWSEDARATFVSELLHDRADSEVAAFAAEDNSIAVKKAAASSLMWNGYDGALTHVLESMDESVFEEIASRNSERMPTALIRKTISAMRNVIERTADHPTRLRTALDLIGLGEKGLDSVIKDSMVALRSSDIRNLGSHYVQPALEYLQETDPLWTSEWVATQVADGVLYEHEYWMHFAPAIPDYVVERCLLRLETEDFKNRQIGGMVAVITKAADVSLAVRVLGKVRELRRRVEAEPEGRHELEWHLMNQLECVFLRLPDDVAAAGVLASVTSGDSLDIRIAADLLGRVAKSDVEPLRISDSDLKARLRAFLKGSVDLVLRQDDFSGEEKANLASSIAQVGEPEDIADLLRLIHADIERMRRGRAARANGDDGPLGSGGTMSYARWHVAAVTHLDPRGAEQVLIELLAEPEYLSEVTAAMAYGFVPKSEHSFDRTPRYDLIWPARENHAPPLGDDHRRERFADALHGEIRRFQGLLEAGEPVVGLKTLAKALAAIDPRASAAEVVDAITQPGSWDEYIRLEAAELLLMGGGVLPNATAFALLDSFLARTGKWVQESDKYLLRRILALLPFVSDPAAGIARMRDVLEQQQLHGYELCELIVALGESRSNAAVNLLFQLSSDPATFQHCEDQFGIAFSTLDTPLSRELLLSLADPHIRGFAVGPNHRYGNVLIARLVELARRRSEVTARLLELCESDLPEPHRHVLSIAMYWLGSPEALAANLNLVDDTKATAVPQGIWHQLESAFVERRSHGQDSNVFTTNTRPSNDLRFRLFKMAIEDKKRRKSALMLLGRIEEWRLTYGRPIGEPRHPDLHSCKAWPPTEP